MIKQTYIVNTYSLSASLFTNFEYNSFCMVGDTLYACGDDGLFVYTDDNLDEGREIPKEIRTGNINVYDFTRAKLSYICISHTGRLDVKVMTLDDQVYLYKSFNNRSKLAESVIKVGKGLADKYLFLHLSTKDKIFIDKIVLILDTL